jgi:F-type H+-transporting ATPase subunit epsilon
MSDKTFQLDIVTPEKKVFSDKVEFSVFPGSEGELGILPDHAPLLSRLAPGVIRITRNKTTESLAISGGFLEVRNNEASVIVETAESATHIDVERAFHEKETAEAAIKNAQNFSEIKSAQFSLLKAEARLKVAGKMPAVATHQDKK